MNECESCKSKDQALEGLREENRLLQCDYADLQTKLAKGFESGVELADRLFKAESQLSKLQVVVEAARKWLATNLESVEYPTPFDAEELAAFLKALRALDTP